MITRVARVLSCKVDCWEIPVKYSPRAGPTQRFRPEGSEGMNGLQDVAQVAHEFINLTLRDHERQGYFQHLTDVTAFHNGRARLAIVGASIDPLTMPVRQVAQIPKRPNSPTRTRRSSISTMTLLELFPTWKWTFFVGTKRFLCATASLRWESARLRSATHIS